MKPSNQFFVLSITSISLLNLGCSSEKEHEWTKSDPVFEWFSYEGNDPVFETFPSAPDEYQNPIIAGFYPDPSITRVGDDYYMVHSSFSYFPGIPIFHSRDLVNWTQIGHVLDRPSQMPLGNIGMSRGIFAPAINYHDGVFYTICTLVDAGGNFLVTATDPAGPWSELIWLPKVEGIDPSIFFDDDGRIYILNNGPPEAEPLYNGHRALWIQEYFPDTQSTGPAKLIVDGGVDIATEPIWIEAPHIKKVGGKYILIAAEGGTGPDHSEVVFRSDSPWGPYIPYENNPILTQRHLDPGRPFPVANAGHADIVQTQSGDWWAVFLAVRPYEAGYFNTGRETFLLPVTWTEDGWPVILEGDATIPFVHSIPNVDDSGLRSLPDPKPEIPTTGNFELIENFDTYELAIYWTFIRTPQSKWYRLRNNALQIQSRDDTIFGYGQPSFIGRRQQHAFASASVKMNYLPGQSGDAAGLVAFQNDDFYYFLGVTKTEGNDIILRLEKRAGARTAGKSQIVSEVPLSPDFSGEIYLKITAKGRYYDFHFGTEPGSWTPVALDEDGTILSTEVAGGFVGAFFGMYGSTSHTPQF